MLERTGFKLFIEFKLKLYFYFVCNSLQSFALCKLPVRQCKQVQIQRWSVSDAEHDVHVNQQKPKQAIVCYCIVDISQTLVCCQSRLLLIFLTSLRFHLVLVIIVLCSHACISKANPRWGERRQMMLLFSLYLRFCKSTQQLQFKLMIAYCLFSFMAVTINLVRIVFSPFLPFPCPAFPSSLPIFAQFSFAAKRPLGPFKPARGLRSAVSCPSGVWGRTPPKSAFWCIQSLCAFRARLGGCKC